MRRLLIPFLALLLIAATSPPSGTPGGGGGARPEQGNCTQSPAACLGAGTPLPGSVAEASTRPDPGCISARIVNPEVGGQSDGMPFCPATDTGAAATGDGGMPAPPTHPEIVATVCPTVPDAMVGHNPHQYGITGIETWLWAAGDTTPRTATGTIRSYPVSCSVTPVWFTFDTGDTHAARFGQHRTYETATPGSEDAATPVRHLWEVTGTYTMTVSVRWQRTTTAGADTVVRTASVDYPVRQVRPGMTTPDH